MWKRMRTAVVIVSNMLLMIILLLNVSRHVNIYFEKIAPMAFEKSIKGVRDTDFNKYF